MKPPLFLVATLTALIFATAKSDAQQPGHVTVRVMLIAMPNAEALLFATKQDLSGQPADALTALEKLVEQKQATSMGMLAVTTKSGYRVLSESGKTTLEVEPVISQDKTAADITILINDRGHKLVTSVTVGREDAKFLGSFLSPTDPTMTEYIFSRVSF